MNAISSGERIDFSDGFPCDRLPFTYIGNVPGYPYPAFELLDEQDPENMCFLRMTADDTFRAGTGAFLPFSFSPENTDCEYGFSMSIGYRIYGELSGSADGMVFVMHQDPRGLSAIGGFGGALGVHEPDPILNSLMIEWDTSKSLCCFVQR